MKKLGKNEETTGLQERTYFITPLQGTISFLFVLLVWLLLGPWMVVLVQPLSNAYLTANAPFLAMALGLVTVRTAILHTSFTALVTDHPRFRFSLFFTSAGVYFATNALFLVFSLLFDDASYMQVSASGLSRLLILFLVLVLTPLQTSCEELLFRVLVVRTALHSRGPYVLKAKLSASLLSAAFFMLPHLGNREVTAAQSQGIVLLYYALFGFLVTYLCLQAGGFEISLAVHAANNLFIALICNYPDSSLPSIPIWETTKPIGTLQDVLQLTVSLAAVALFVRKSLSKHHSVQS